MVEFTLEDVHGPCITGDVMHVDHHDCFIIWREVKELDSDRVLVFQVEGSVNIIFDDELDIFSVIDLRELKRELILTDDLNGIEMMVGLNFGSEYFVSLHDFGESKLDSRDIVWIRYFQYDRDVIGIGALFVLFNEP
jgi:hypothetical protein